MGMSRSAPLAAGPDFVEAGRLVETGKLLQAGKWLPGGMGIGRHPGRGDPGGAEGFGRLFGSGRTAPDPFQNAARHSRRVRLLRKLIPAIVVFALVVVIAISIFNPWRMLVKLPLDMGNLVISGTKITMESPRLAGFTPDKRAYEVSAKAAAQDLTKPDFVELNVIHAKVELEDKTVVQMNASNGLYDTKAEILKLNDSILLQSSNGYEGRLSEAVIDIRKGMVKSDKPVAIKLLNGDLNANRLEILETGALVRFGGGVTMNLMLNEHMAPPNEQPAQTDKENPTP